MEEMYDMHIHLIFGVDDGPKEIEESVGMLEQAAREGIRVMIATPHKRYGMFEYDIGTVEKNYEELKIRAEELGIRLYLGCEYHACSEMIKDLKEGRVHTLCDTNYVLCEFAFSTAASEMEDAVYRLIVNGYKPVIAHVERYGVIQKSPIFCRELRKKGAYIQVNSGSLVGEEGGKLRRTARFLLKHGLVDVIASDAHGTKYRRSSLAKAYKYVVKRYTEEYAKELFTQLTWEIVNGAPTCERKASDE